MRPLGNRFCFEWHDGVAANVEIVDYHEGNGKYGNVERRCMIVPKNRRPISPGEVLQEDYLEPLGLTQGELAKALRVDRTTVTEIVKGRRAVTPEMAIRFAHAFRTTPQYWLNLQIACDLFDALHSEVTTRVRRLPVLVEA